MDSGVAVEPLARQSAITALAVSPPRRSSRCPGTNKSFYLTALSHKPLKALAFPEGDVFALQFSRDGGLLLAGGGVGGMSGKVVAFEWQRASAFLKLATNRTSFWRWRFRPTPAWLLWVDPAVA